MCKSNTNVKNLLVYAKQLVKEQEQKAADCSARLAKAPPTTPVHNIKVAYGVTPSPVALPFVSVTKQPQ